MAYFSRDRGRDYLSRVPPDCDQPEEELTKIADGSSPFNDLDCGDLDKLKAWLDSGHSANHYVPQFSHGFPPSQTPLMAVCSNAFSKNALEVVKYLVEEKGANVNQRRLDIYEDTPLLAAAGNGKVQIVKYLLEHGADVNLRDNRGRGIFEKATNEVAMFVEKWLEKRRLLPLRLICLQKVIAQCDSLDEIDNLHAPDELKEDLKKNYWKHRKILHIHEPTQNWIRYLPLHKESLRQVLICIIKATKYNVQKEKDNYIKSTTAEIKFIRPNQKKSEKEEKKRKKSESEEKKQKTEKKTKDEKKEKKKSNRHKDGEIIKSEYIVSGNSLKPDTWVLHFPGGKKFQLVYMEANYHTWNASWKVDGLKDLMSVVTSLGLDKEDTYPFLLFLFGYAVKFTGWTDRKRLLFPETLKGSGNMPEPPQYFRELATEWCGEKKAQK